MASMAYSILGMQGMRGFSRMFRNRTGQATVEFALVLFAFLAFVAGLGALCDFGRSGALAEHASESASHTIGGSDVGAWADVLAY